MITDSSFTKYKIYIMKQSFLLKTLKHVSYFIVLAFISCGCNTLKKQLKLGWNTKEITPGVQLSNKYFTSLFDTLENINILTVDLHDTAVQIKIAFNDSLLQPVSEFGKANNAIAAVNGNFFNTKIGGSVCYMRVDGRVINRTHDELNGTLFLPWLDTAAMAINGNRISIIIKPQNMNWTEHLDTFSTVISAGPLLVWNNKIVPQQNHRFNNKRYSRTGIGLTKSNKLLIIAVDGNAKESAGVTNKEFAKLFKTLKCVSALNFDGGGSTTMWVKGEAENGVINHPTDNKKYDHFGERKVANAILIMKDKRN